MALDGPTLGKWFWDVKGAALPSKQAWQGVGLLWQVEVSGNAIWRSTQDRG